MTYPKAWPEDKRLAAIRRLTLMLHDAGIVEPPLQPYHTNPEVSEKGLFRIEVDSSDLFTIELITPVMKDKKTWWRKLVTAMEVIERSGAVTSMKTSGHVHVGAAVLDRNVGKYIRLLRLVERLEDALFRWPPTRSGTSTAELFTPEDCVSRQAATRWMRWKAN